MSEHIDVNVNEPPSIIVDVSSAPSIIVDVQAGQPGQDGVGVPTGGNADELLRKISATDYDFEWFDASTVYYTIATADATFQPLGTYLTPASSLDDLGDVTATNPDDEDILQWNGFSWVSVDRQTAGLALLGHQHTLADILDSGLLATLNQVDTAEIADEAVGPGQLQDTAVTPGIYTSANITVDQQGRIVAAANGAPVVGAIDDLSDVTITSVADQEVLSYLGGSWINRTLAEAGIAADIHSHTASQIISGTFADARISESSVTQHEAALTITESQISDLGTYLTDLTGESINSLSDVSITGLGNAEILYSSGGTWINRTLAEAGIAALSHTHVEADITDLGPYQPLDPILTSVADLMDPGMDMLIFWDASNGGMRWLTAGDNLEFDGTQLNVIGGTTSELSDLSDVNTSTPTNRNVLVADGTDFESRALTEADISDLGSYLTDITGSTTGELSDVTLSLIAGGELLVWNGSAWINQTLAEAGIADAAHTHVASDITSGTFADGRVAESNVTQHEAALTITESQISDLGNYQPAGNYQTQDDLLDDIAALTDPNADRILFWDDGLSTTNWLTVGSGLTLFGSDLSRDPITVGELDDVTLSLISGGELLVWNGSAWINQTFSEAGIAPATHTHTEADITDLGNYLEDITSQTFGQLSDVVIGVPLAGQLVYYDGFVFRNADLATAGVAAASHTHGTSDITSGTFVDARIAESNVTQHEAALTITESQISDLGNYQVFDTMVESLAQLNDPNNDRILFWDESNNGLRWLIAGTNLTITGDTINATGSGGGAGALADLSDVNTSTPTNRNVLVADGTDFESRALVEADISDLGTYLTTEVNDLSASVTWVNVPDANITQSSVTQHEAALSITESQISDLGTYLTNINGESLGDLSDVTETSVANGEVLFYNGGWQNATLGEAGIAAATHVQAAGTITSGTFADARIAESNVTQHEGALSIGAGQVTGLATVATTNSYTDLDDIPTLLTGTGVDNQLAVWTSANGLEGDSNFTWDGSDLSVTGDATVSNGTSTNVTVGNQVSNSTASTQTFLGKSGGGTNISGTIGIQTTGRFAFGVSGQPEAASFNVTNGDYRQHNGVMILHSTSYSSNSPLLVAARDWNGSGNTHAFVDEQTITGSASSGHNSFDGDATYDGSNNYDHIAVFQARPAYASSGTIDRITSCTSTIAHTGGTCTTLRGFAHVDPTGAGAITNHIGLDIGTLTRGTNNYAISVGDSDADQNLIHVGVTGDPLFAWDESEDEFTLSHDLNVPGISGVSSIDATTEATIEGACDLADFQGNLPVSKLNGGLGASSSTYWRGDGVWATVAGGGDVTKVGTPANNEIGVWTGDGTIEGDSNLTWDGASLEVTASDTFRYTSSGTGDVAKFIGTEPSGTFGGALMSLVSDDGAAMGSGHRLGGLSFEGAEAAGGVLHSAAAVSAYTTEAWSPSANGCEVRFQCTATGETARDTVMTLDGGGLTIGSSGAGNGKELFVYCDNDDWPVFEQNQNARALELRQTTASGTGGGTGMYMVMDDGAAMASGHRLGYLVWAGAEDSSSNLNNSVGMFAYATETWTGSTAGARLAVEVCPGGGTQSRSTVAEFYGDHLNLSADFDLRFDDNNVLGESGGTITLSSIDAIDATTEATLEAALDFAAVSHTHTVSDITDLTVSSTAPVSPSTGDLWVDIS